MVVCDSDGGLYVFTDGSNSYGSRPEPDFVRAGRGKYGSFGEDIVVLMRVGWLSTSRVCRGAAMAGSRIFGLGAWRSLRLWREPVQPCLDFGPDLVLFAELL